MRKSFFIIIGIVILGFVLRFYQLGSIPISLNWDEVSIGYNSYSILQTGRDEYGTFLPLTIRSFGDYKQPAYVYLSTLPIKLFGLSPFAVRFTSALLGTLSVIIVYLLASEILHTLRQKDMVASVVTFLFAVSPWSIQFSRFASEANVALFFLLLGTWLFLRAVRSRKDAFLFLADISLLISIYTYHSQKIFTPILLGLLLIYHLQYFLKRKVLLMVFIAVFILGNIPWLIDSSATKRGLSVLLTSQQTQLLKDPIELSASDTGRGDIAGSLLHNRRVVYTREFIKNYLSHFDPNFLFIKGDNARHHAPDMGVVYLVSLPFILFGFLTLWRDYKKQAVLLTAWLLAAPLVSALAIDAPSSIRSMMFLPLWQIFAAVGIVQLMLSLRNKQLARIVRGLVVCLYAVSIFYFVHQYLSHTNLQYAKYWQDGYKEAVLASQNLKDKPVYFAQDIEQAQAFYLFYTKKDPQSYLESGGSVRVEKECFNIDNAYFGRCDSGFGYIITSYQPLAAPHAQEVKKITYPNGESALSIYSILQ